MAKFRINYDKVINQANDMWYLADDLRRCITDLNNAQASNGWDGPAAQTFRRKLSALISDMQQTKTDIETVVGKIRTTAKNIQAMDERLAREAEEKL